MTGWPDGTVSAMAAETHDTAARIDAMLAAYAADLAGALPGIALPTRPATVYTVARGSSDHAASVLHWLLARDGIVATTLPPSLLQRAGCACPDATMAAGATGTSTPSLHGSVVLSISQSGASPDLVDAVQAARGAGAATIALVNREDSPLADAAEFIVPVLAGPERAVAATKSLVCSIVAGECLAQRWSGRRDSALVTLAEQWRARIDDGVPEELVALLCRDEPILVIGRGTGFGIAGEVALKIQELLGRAAMAYSSAEVLHGPAGMVREGYPVLALQSGPAASAVAESAARLADLGASVHNLRCEERDDDFAPVLQLATLYAALELACRELGRSPDKPANLQKVTLTH